MPFVEIEKRSQETGFNMTEFQSHNFFELYFLAAGDRELFVENKLFLLTPGTFCVIPPYHIHKTEGGPYTRINIYVSEDMLSDQEKKHLARLSQGVAYAFSEAQATFVQGLLEVAHGEGIGDPAVRQNHMHAFVKALISYLGVQDLAPVTPFGSSPSHTRNDTAVLKIAAYVNEHYKESLTLQFLSDKFFMSKNTLCKRFRSAMDISVMQYVTYVRMNKAKMYLTTTAKSMEEVAEQSGFPSANYFSFIFKKSFGISPTEYRKKH